MQDFMGPVEHLILSLGFPIALCIGLLFILYRLGASFLAKLDEKTDKISQNIVSLNASLLQFINITQIHMTENNKQWDKWDKRFEAEMLMKRPFWYSGIHTDD